MYNASTYDIMKSYLNGCETRKFEIALDLLHGKKGCYVMNNFTYRRLQRTASRMTVRFLETSSCRFVTKNNY